MTHRLAIFGDSHYACMKMAYDQGLVTVPASLDLEFWGHVGTRFRHLSFADDAITPVDETTAARFAKFSTRNRTTLPIHAFDTVFFMGCRIPVFSAFAQIISAERQGPPLSGGLRRRVLRDHLHAQAPYGFARQAAALGAARIIVMPIAFPTWWPEGDTKSLPRFPDAPLTEISERQQLWQDVAQVMAADNITLLAQPDDTVTAGLFTHPDWAVDGYREKPDLHHRNAAYGARAFGMLLEALTGAGAGGAASQTEPPLQAKG